VGQRRIDTVRGEVIAWRERMDGIGWNLDPDACSMGRLLWQSGGRWVGVASFAFLAFLHCLDLLPCSSKFGVHVAAAGKPRAVGPRRLTATLYCESGMMCALVSPSVHVQQGKVHYTVNRLI
jgi:hypothetical protein